MKKLFQIGLNAFETDQLSWKETNMDQKYGPGVYKTCSAREVEIFSGYGWEVVDSFINEKLEKTTEHVIDPGAQQHSYQKTIALDKHVCVRETMFLMRIDPECALANARAEIDRLHTTARDTRHLFGISEEKVTKLTADLEVLQKSTNDLRIHGNERQKEVEALRAQKQKMERDIAKIREAVGALKVKEILAEETKK